MHRRLFLLSSIAALRPAALLAEPKPAGTPLRLGLTPVFLDDQVAFLNTWRSYLETRLKRPVVFVQRASYREIIDMLRGRQLAVAWICGAPYVRHANELRLLAVPVWEGRPVYQSYLIVPAVETRTRSIVDLRGKIFAYSDPDSNSGYLFPIFALSALRERSNTFFARTFFTWGHRKVVEAVAAGLADGGAVDGYVWETLNKLHPEITAGTRVAAKSPDFGFPPLVAHAGLARAELAATQRVLLGMVDDTDGRSLLQRLNLDGFAPGNDALFDGIRRMVQAVRLAPSATAS